MHIIRIKIEKEFSFEAYVEALGMELRIEFSGDKEWYFTAGEESTTMFLLVDDGAELHLMMGELAAYCDYRLYPYLADVLREKFVGEIEGLGDDSVYECYGEVWAEEMIGEEIALLKSTLSVAPRYYIDLAKEDYTYVTKEMFLKCAVGLTSSTPRIYGYLHLMMRRGMLAQASEEELFEDMSSNYEGIEVDVPQHESIGKIRSWQTDGAETWDSFSKEDVDMLLSIREEDILAEVLNDIGSVYQEGIGTNIDGKKAEYWFKKAISRGDLRYAATNLGDLYRKGCGIIEASLPQAFEAYSVSEDPYAWYRIGQAYEEGWIGVSNIEKAMLWYNKAAAVGHWRALERLAQE